MYAQYHTNFLDLASASLLLSSLQVESGVSTGAVGVIKWVFTGTGPRAKSVRGWGRDFLETFSVLGGSRDSDLELK